MPSQRHLGLVLGLCWCWYGQSGKMLAWLLLLLLSSLLSCNSLVVVVLAREVGSVVGWYGHAVQSGWRSARGSDNGIDKSKHAGFPS